MSLDAVLTDAQLMERARVGTSDGRYGAVDGIALGPDSPLAPRKRNRNGAQVRRRRGSPEHYEQVALIRWAEEQQSRRPELWALFAVTNWFGKPSKAAGGKAKAEGRKPGVPDLWLPVARGGYHGLVIEMKSGKNGPTHEQRQWLRFLDTAGYLARVCWSADDAKQLITHYLDGQMTIEASHPC